MKMRKIFKKYNQYLAKIKSRIFSNYHDMSFRRKIMIVSIIVIGSSYFSAPFGMILLACGLLMELYKRPGRSLSFREIVKTSVFLIPGAILLISSVVGPIYFKNYLNAGLALLVLFPILLCAVLIEILWQKEDALNFARYTTILIIPVSIIAFLFPWSGGSFLQYTGNIRIAGTFSNPNYFSYVLEMILLFCIALYYHVWKNSSRIWLMVAFFLSFISLYFTGSRTGMLAFFVGVTVYFLCMSEKTILVIVFGGLTLVLVGTAIFPEQSVFLFKDLIPRPETFLAEINNRFMLWDVALKQISKNPFMGTGLDTYRNLVPKDAPELLRTSIHCHNIFINLWLETGIAGLLAFVWIFSRAGISAIRQLKNSTVRPYLSAGIGMIVVTIVHGIMDAPLVSAQTLSFFGIFLACLVVMNRKEPSV